MSAGARAAGALALMAVGAPVAFTPAAPPDATGPRPLAAMAAVQPCTDCHPGADADTVTFEGLWFAHAAHVGLEGGCAHCHVDHVTTGTAPGVEVGRVDCQACHHGPARRGMALCEQCHETIFGTSVTFQGRPFSHSVHVGAFTGLGCDDCHGEADEEVVASPSPSACVGCHPSGAVSPST
jgi:hypothetical protein